MDNQYLFDTLGDETVTFSDNNLDFNLDDFSQFDDLPSVPQATYPTSESPFTSNIIATPAAIRVAHNSRSDTRLKNRLFGIGTNGGFLTSPVIKGNNKGHTPADSNPAIVDFIQGNYMMNQYPMQMQQVPAQMQYGNEENTYPLSYANNNYFVSAPAPVSAALQQPQVMQAPAMQYQQPPQQTGLGMAGLDLADYTGGNMRIYGVPIDSNKSPASQAAAPLSFLPYPEHLPTMTLGRGKKNVRDVGPLDLPKVRSPNPGSPPAAQPSRCPSSKTKNKKLLSVRTASITSPKLSKTPRKAVSSPNLKSRAVAPHHYPLTPSTSQHQFFDPNAMTFNNQGPIAPFNTPAQHGQTPQAVSEPFSFADLYNLGLVEGGPMDFSALIEKQDPNAQLNMDDPFSPPLSAASSALDDYAFLQSLPTPALVGESCFSSPASAWTASPALSPAGSHHSMQENFVLDALNYGMASPSLSPAMSHHSMHDQYNMDAIQFSPAMQNFNAMMNPGQLPDLPTASGSNQMMQGQWNQPQYPHQLPQQQAMDFLSVDPYAQPVEKIARRQVTLNKKRSRDDFDADQTEDESDDDEYVPCDMPSPQSKKQRTVSAPMPQATTGRRLKPGPKPRSKASSDNLRQYAGAPVPRSVSAGPPPAELRAQVLSQVPVAEHDHSQCGSDCEEETAGLPKSVIRSLYQPLAPQSGQTKKYVCLIEGCGRVFPRKSAIESHIQTHLEDKPFVCPHDDCNAAFVRQHDLRRHERIHSGTKPFPCPCGKGFARGDALMRHRQRGICVGSIVPRRS